MSVPSALVWFQFAVCLILIVFAGVKLSKYADVIADKTGMGGTWIGLILLAVVTSLPELATGISSVTVANVPDIAAGDIMGSCVFNLLIIVVLDFLHPDEPVYRKASQGHILSAGFGIMLLGLTAFSILLIHLGVSYPIGHIGIYAIPILIIYGIAMISVFRYETKHIAEFTDALPDRYPAMSLQQAITKYIAAAVVVVAAGSWLPFVAKELSNLMGWEHSFVGTLFVAFVTSAPELVTTIAALKIGALDMAVSNLFGSNLFNILILVIDDFFYLKGPLLMDVSPAHAVSALSALMMTGVAIVGLLYRPKTQLFHKVGWASVFLLLVYFVNSYVLFRFGD